jgi:hypothetical protein
MSFVISDFLHNLLLKKNEVDIDTLKKLKKFKKQLSKLAFEEFDNEPVIPEHIKKYIDKMQDKYNVRNNNIKLLDWRRTVDIYIDKIEKIINISRKKSIFKVNGDKLCY